MNFALRRSLETWAGQPIIESIGWSLVHFLWQGLAVALLVALALSAMRRSSAGSRYLAACAGLLLMVACPMITLAWSGVFATDRPVLEKARADRIEVVSIANRPAPANPPLASTDAETRDRFNDAESGSPLIPGRSEPTLMRSLLPWFVLIWLVGVALISVRLCAGWFGLWRMRMRQTKAVSIDWDQRLRRISTRVGVTKTVKILESALVEVPSLIGWIKPVILLPASCLAGLSTDQLEAILAHELAHVRRHDYLANLFQTAIETLLFYHPAVWWVSRTIRAEREACCDEVAVEVSGDRLRYAQALVSMEELRGRPEQLLVAASGGPLLARVRRLVGIPEPRANHSAWWVMAALASGVLAMLAHHASRNAQANHPEEPPAQQAPATLDEWGPESGGLRCRLVATPVDANDESPDMAKSTNAFARSDDLTLAVELKNVTDKPMSLLGVRYSDAYPTAVGKLNTASLGPILFALEFTDNSGKPLARPSRESLDSMLQLSGASAHEIAPGKSLVVLLRPSGLSRPMNYELPPGSYKARVTYRGPSKAVAERLNKFWPDRPQGKAWTGEVVSNQVAFRIAEGPKAPARFEPHWGDPKGGLQAAMELRPRPEHRSPTEPPDTVPINSQVDISFHVKNVSDQPVSFLSETWRQEDGLDVKDEAGASKLVRSIRFSGWPIMVRWTLRPGEVAVLETAGLGVATDEEAINKYELLAGKTIIVKPGEFSFKSTVRISKSQPTDAQGKELSPSKVDWQGDLVTGETKLKIRARTPEDEALARAGEFIGKVNFVGPKGEPVILGSFTARSSGKRHDSEEMAIGAGPQKIPDCSDQPLTIQVLAPGYEEALFYDVKLKPEETKRLELKESSPTVFRLISSVDGKAIVGAKVRFFNKTADDAGGGPYPMKGIEGPVWATSHQDGKVMLGSLQKIDPYYAKLGASVYYFYIEAPGLTGRFLGGVKAGMDLGDIAMGPPLEVVGEVRGTPEELERFDAEWDQPFEMRTTNPAAAFDYSVSERLETKREGDKLTFRLTGLRHGKLRIISNFGPRPHSVSHTYGRRDPKGSDVVVEVALKGPIDKLILTPEGRKPGPLSMKIRIPEPGMSQPGRLLVEFTNESTRPVKVWKNSNSWGYDNMTLTLRRRNGDPASSFQIKPSPCAFTKNGPSFSEIQPGKSLRVDINLGNGFWELPPRSFDHPEEELEVRAEFDSGPSPEADKYGVFVGSSESGWIRSKPPHSWLKFKLDPAGQK